jgi:hypothetical protein
MANCMMIREKRNLKRTLKLDPPDNLYLILKITLNLRVILSLKIIYLCPCMLPY